MTHTHWLAIGFAVVFLFGGVVGFWLAVRMGKLAVTAVATATADIHALHDKLNVLLTRSQIAAATAQSATSAPAAPPQQPPATYTLPPAQIRPA